MKKLLTTICVGALICALSISSVGAYILPSGLSVSLEEGNGFSGSATEIFGCMGDSDLNGKINVRDATLIQKYAANISVLSDEAIRLADVDFSEKVNVRDATAIQKWLAGISVYAPVGHTLYATDDETQAGFLVDKWFGKYNIADIYNQSLGESGVEGPEFSCIELPLRLELNSDSTYKFEIAEEYLDETVVQMQTEFSSWMYDYLDKYIKENNLNTTVEMMVKLSGYTSIEDLAKDAIPAEEFIESFSGISQQGRYLVKGNGIYASDSVDAQPEISSDAFYYDLKDINLIIFADNDVPIEFVRVR